MNNKKPIVFFIVVAVLTSAMPLPSLMAPTSNQVDRIPLRNSAVPSPQVLWNRTYGGTGLGEAWSVQQTSDGGYIVVGGTRSAGAGLEDFWLVKTDVNGNPLWNKTYGGTWNDGAFSVQQTSDGGYIVAGYTQSSGAGGSDYWLVKTDGSGNHQWNKTYGGPGNDYASSVRQTSDGYIVAGYKDNAASLFDFWLVKTDSAGNHQWNKTYGGKWDDYAYSVQQTTDGGYITAGYTTSFGAGSGDFWLVKTDASGNMQWNKTDGGGSDDEAQSIQQTSDGGYIVAGYTESGASGRDFWLVKTDSSGNQQWNKTYGGTGTDWAYSTQQTSDGGYIVAGSTDSSGAGFEDFWLVKTDASGNQQWNETYGGTQGDWAHFVATTSDGGYIAAGYTESFGVSGSDFWLVKTWDATPPSAIIDLAAGSPTNNSITLTWTAPGDNLMAGNATGYVVKYSTSGPITEANWASATTYVQSWTPVKNGTNETRMVTDLSPGTSYWFAVEACDDVSPPNCGGVSNSPVGTTLTPDWSTNPPVLLVPGVGNNATTPPEYFQLYHFSVTTNNATNVVLISSDSAPPTVGSPPGGTHSFIYLDLKGQFMPDANVVTVYLFYNRTTVQQLQINETTLRLYRWNSTTSQWDTIPGSTLVINSTHGVVIGYLAHFSYFAVFGFPVSGAGSGTGQGTQIFVVVITAAAVVATLVAIIIMKRRRSLAGDYMKTEM